MSEIMSEEPPKITALAHGDRENRWRTEALRAHKTPRLLVFTKGQGRITVAGRLRGLGPNTLVYLPAGTLYGIELGSTGFAQLITIPTAQAEDWPDALHLVRLRDVSSQKDLAGLLDHLERDLQSDEPLSDRAALHRLGLLAVFLARQLARSADAPAPAAKPTASAAETLVEAYAGLIARDFHEGLSVADYARRLGVTPTHLTRCCRRSCDRSALALLRESRMYEARRLLRNTQLPVATIARNLGFSSAAYFTRAFQSFAGMTPTRFRAHGPVALA